MSKETPENILARIRKLLSLAEGAKKVGSLAEAESAALKAQELMAQYNLELHDIKKDEPDKFKVEKNTLDGDDLNVKNEGSWLFELYKVIAGHNYCMIIYTDLPSNDEVYKQRPAQENFDEYWEFMKAYNKWHKKAFPSGKTLIVLGEPHNVEMTKYIVEQLSSKVRPLCRTAWKKYDGEWQMYSMDWQSKSRGDGGIDYDKPKVPVDENGNEKEKKNAFVRGFLLGFVDGVSYKLNEQKAKMEKKQPQLKTMGLMIINKVEKWQKENIPTTSFRSNAGRSKSNTGKDEGFKAGKNASINKGVGKSTFNQNLLN